MSTHDVGTRLDQLYRRVTEPLAARVSRMPGITANRVSVAAFVAGGVVTPVLLLCRRPRAAGVAFVLSDLLDYLDGDVARAQHKASAQGDVLDGILDRYTDLLCIAAMTLSASGLAGAEPTDIGRPGRSTALAVGTAALIGSLMPSYIQALAVANNRRTVQSIGGRGTRNRIVFAGLLAGRPFWSLVAIAALGNAASVHRAVHVLGHHGDRSADTGGRRG